MQNKTGYHLWNGFRITIIRVNFMFSVIHLSILEGGRDIRPHDRYIFPVPQPAR